MNLTFDEKFILMVDTKSDFGEATLDVEDEVQPNTLPCRKLPLLIKDRVKTERDKYVDSNHIHKMGQSEGCNPQSKWKTDNLY